MTPRTALLGFGLVFALAPSCGKKDSDSGSTTSSAEYYLTCGDPVCQGYTGPFTGVPLCSDVGISVGDACDTADLDETCDPVDSCNARLICATDDPTQQTGGCPISRAKHKDGIEYLDPQQRAQAGQRALEMKLATWRYAGELDDGKEHLGFIIDDDPTSPAVRPDGEHVDLYGYTSLAVAALQEQQARIERLEARLIQLEEQCGSSE